MTFRNTLYAGVYRPHTHPQRKHYQCPTRALRELQAGSSSLADGVRRYKILDFARLSNPSESPVRTG